MFFRIILEHQKPPSPDATRTKPRREELHGVSLVKLLAVAKITSPRDTRISPRLSLAHLFFVNNRVETERDSTNDTGKDVRSLAGNDNPVRHQKGQLETGSHKDQPDKLFRKGQFRRISRS